MVPIKIVYDKYENETGFIQTVEQGNHIHKKVEGTDETNEIFFHTWGKMKHKPIECDLTFDATLFSSTVAENVDIKCLSGLDEIIQQSIMNHPNFDLIIERMVTLIEEKNPTTVGIFCNYGKHRSVGIAELLHKIYYPLSRCVHQGLK